MASELQADLLVSVLDSHDTMGFRSVAWTVVGILECLVAAGGADDGAREQAEATLAQMACSVPEYGVALASIISTQDLPLEARLIASVVLRKYVDKHWQADIDAFEPPEVPGEAKGMIREMLISLLADGHSKIRSMAAYCTSTVAGWDWPESWPNLFEQLVGGLHSNQPEIIHGVMRVLSEFVLEIDSSQLGQIVPILVPEMYKVATEEEAWDARTRTRAIEIFTKLAEAVQDASTGKSGKSLFKEYLVPLLPQWMATLAALLGQTEDRSDIGIKVAALASASVLIDRMPSKIRTEVPQLLGPVWATLTGALEKYLTTVVEEAEVVDEVVDDDGNVMGQELLVFELFQFVEAVFEDKKLKHLLSDSLGEILSVTLSYMRMTSEQEESWLDDAEAFVSAEADERTNFNVRIQGESCITTIRERYGAASCQLLIEAASGQIQQAEELRAAGNESWWKLVEASFLALGRFSEDFLKDITNKGIDFDLAGFVGGVVLDSCGVMELPFLAARGLWLAGEWAEHLPAQLVAPFLQHAVVGLQGDAPSPVKVSALWCIMNICREHRDSGIAETMEPVINALVALAPSCGSEVLYQVVQTLQEVVQISPEVTSAYQEKLLPLSLAIFLRSNQDNAMACAVSHLFDCYAAIPDMGPGLVERALPTLTSLLRQHNSPDVAALVDVAVNVITGLAKSSTSPLTEALLSDVFPVLVETLMSTVDSTLLQAGGDCIKMFLSQHFEALMQCSYGEVAALELIMQVIAYMLSPDTSEGASSFIGRLITLVILKAGDALGDYVSDLLVSVLEKLLQAKTLTVIESLLLIFARLIIQDCETVVNFLDSKDVLAVVLGLLTENHADFFGAYAHKVSSSAITTLLLSGDDRLHSVMVKGPEIRGEGLRTRSKTRSQGGQQFSQVPAAQRLFQILVQEYEMQCRKLDNDAAEGESGSEGEWEDEPEVNPLGYDGTFADADDYHLMASDMIDLGLGVDLFAEEEEDPEILADPLNQLDLKAHLTEFFATAAQQGDAIQQLSAILTPVEQQVLQSVFEG